jgi:hypothetical protein
MTFHANFFVDLWNSNLTVVGVFFANTHSIIILMVSGKSIDFGLPE